MHSSRIISIRLAFTKLPKPVWAEPRNDLRTKTHNPSRGVPAALDLILNEMRDARCATS
jgi:hypothetical protein